MKTLIIPICLFSICGLFIGCNYARGIACFETGNYVKAIENFEEAIRRDPNDVVSYAWLGRSYSRIGDFDKAITAFEAGHRIQPNNNILQRWIAEVEQMLQSPQTYQSQQSTFLKNTTQSNQNSNTRQSLGNLKNTSWGYYSEYYAQTLDNYGSAGWGMGSAAVSHTERINFGNGDYIHIVQKRSTSLMHAENSTETGTYYVSGNTVVLTSSEGYEKRGNISGNTLIIGNIFYDRY